MKKRNFLTVFAAVMISLLMLCGCSEDDVGEIDGAYVGTDISRYIDSIGEEPTETLSETVSEDDTETSDGKMSDGENSNDEIFDSETAAKTVISDEITSADIPETSEADLSETEKAVQKYYFRSEKLFDSHYEKHGAEFGDITQDEYLDLANELINAEGEKQSETFGVKYLPNDFKKENGYKRSVEISTEYGLYRQHYCGCIYSKYASLPGLEEAEESEGEK